MHYRCTHINGRITRSPDKAAVEATQHMEAMAAQGVATCVDFEHGAQLRHISLLGVGLASTQPGRASEGAQWPRAKRTRPGEV